MNTSVEIVQLRDEVFRKIGRNVVNFQKIETMLKFLLTVTRVKGSASMLSEITEQRRRAFDRYTLGRLVEEFHGSAGCEADDPPCSPAGISEPWLNMHVPLDDSAFLTEQESALRKLAQERNDLIHHLVPRWDLESAADLAEASQHLDNQRARLAPVFEDLKSIVISVRSAFDVHKRFLDSSEGERLFELIFVQSSAVVWCLVDFASKDARADGWSTFASAGMAIRQNPAALRELSEFKTKWGLKTLKAIAESAAMFESTRNPLPTGVSVSSIESGMKKMEAVKVDLRPSSDFPLD